MRTILLAVLSFLSVAVPCVAQTREVKLPPEFSAMRLALCDKPADFVESGCKVCPKFLVQGSQGLIGGGLGINSVLFGSFTSVGETEALLSGAGCFSHAEGFGSAFLLRKEQGVWRRLAFFHRDGPMGICQNVPGQGARRDLLVCNYEDYGAGAISLIALDAGGGVKSQEELVQTWGYQGWRSVEKQNHCSSSGAEVKKLSFDSIEISVSLNSFDVDPPINCFNESDSTTSKISNSRRVKSIAVFQRNNEDFVPDEKTKKLLSEVARGH
jgi:hypothetical protein